MLAVLAYDAPGLSTFGRGTIVCFGDQPVDRMSVRAYQADEYFRIS